MLKTVFANYDGILHSVGGVLRCLSTFSFSLMRSKCRPFNVCLNVLSPTLVTVKQRLWR